MKEVQKNKLIKMYDNCEHLKIYTKTEIDNNGRTHRYSGCIKCMLDERVWDIEPQALSEEQLIQREYFLSDKFENTGIHTRLKISDLEAMHYLYNHIKEEHPLVSDNTIADLINENIQLRQKNKTLKKGR